MVRSWGISLGSEVKNYFNFVARKYEQQSKNGIWSIIRKYELKGFDFFAKEIKPNDIIIDLGCGVGFYTEYIAKEYSKNIYGVDFSPNMLREVESKGLKTIEVNLEEVTSSQLPIFDWVIAMGSLEFIENTNSLINSLKIKGKYRSKVIVLIPRDGVVGFFYRFVHVIWKCPTSKRSSKELINSFESIGFKLVARKAAGPVSQLLKFQLENS